MPPAGRPRRAANRDLPPGLLRRERRGLVRYYYQGADGHQVPLGTDRDAALAQWQALHAGRRRTPPARGFAKVANEFEAHGIKGLAVKTQTEYRLGLARLRKVFGTAPLESIQPIHIGQMMHALRGTPHQANRMKALVSRMWNWARSRGMTSAPNPCTGIDGYTETPRKVIVTPEMFWAVHDAGTQRLRDWMELDRLIGDRVSDVLTLKRSAIVHEGGADWLLTTSTKTGTLGRMTVTGDLAALLERLRTRPRKATGPWLIQSDTGQRITYAMLHDDFTAARNAVRQTAPALADWQLRDMRKTSLNDAGTLEEARRRAKHTDPRTTARHYEVRIDAVPGKLPGRGTRG